MNFKKLLLGMFFLLLISCASRSPREIDQICTLFKHHPQWYWDAEDVERRWKIPIAVQMAIIHQESKFNGNARPKRTKLLWIIPWKRPSSAFGYTQALNGTWSQYKNAGLGANFLVSRSNFSHAVNFIGWYANQANQRAGISREDAYNLYLAYHEGIGGFERKTYLQKPWLMLVALKVKARSQLFRMQLNHCRQTLPTKPWYKLW